MFRYPICLLVVLVFSSTSLECHAQSLWHRRTESKVFLFRDTQARQIGDLVTIVVKENTDVDHKDERALEKQTESSGQFNYAGASAGDNSSNSSSASLDISNQTERKFDGSSELTVEREFSDRITVSVLDVLPNGNLVVGGKRRQLVAGEARTLIISGIVLQIDINPDNTIQSQFVGNFAIDYKGQGPESAFANQGWFNRALNAVWPF
ncbi:MAG: flagellar basal body L-ring protein FlgH [Pirellulales bacterium]